MGENGDPDALAGLGELASRHADARSMLLMGKAALNRGLPFDFYAYPVTGIPAFKSIGPEVEQSIMFAIARQESAFNPSVVSPAQAYGLMQVTPDAGRYVCKKYGASFDLGRMKTDPTLKMPVDRDPRRAGVPPISVDILEGVAVSRPLDESARLVRHWIVRSVGERTHRIVADIYAS